MDFELDFWETLKCEPKITSDDQHPTLNLVQSRKTPSSLRTITELFVSRPRNFICVYQTIQYVFACL